MPLVERPSSLAFASAVRTCARVYPIASSPHLMVPPCCDTPGVGSLREWEDATRVRLSEPDPLVSFLYVIGESPPISLLPQGPHAATLGIQGALMSTSGDQSLPIRKALSRA